jgi:hypothetical protein
MATKISPSAAPDSRLKASNRRTAFVLAAIAATFFAGIIGSKFIGGQATGLSVLGIAALLYLVVAIGRNLRDKR